MDSPTTPAERPRPSMLVPHNHVWPSATNPRTRFDEASLKELAASMTPAIGIIEPLVVRPHPTKGPDYEIVAGERRWRAAKMAGLVEVPIIVRHLDDAQVLDLQLIENKHRADIHPLDEARAMERRIKLDRQLTAKGMAKFIGVSERYVQNRLRYLTLVPDAQKVFLNGEITSGHADLLIRLPAEDQKTALKDGLFSEMFDTGDDSDFYGGEVKDGKKPAKRLRSTREFDEWLKENVRLKPEAAAASGLFPEVAEALTGGTFVVGDQRHDGKTGQKVDAPTLLEVVDGYYVGSKNEKNPPLGDDQWKEVKKGEKCEHQQRAVLVLGSDQGRILSVCTAKKACKIHWAHQASHQGSYQSTYKPSKEETARRERERKASAARQVKHQLWQKVKPKALAALRQAAATLKPGPKAYQLISRGFYGARRASTLADLVVAAAQRELYDADRFALFAKPLGLDLKPLMKAAAPKPAKRAPAKKAKQKPARAFLQKGARAGVVKALGPKKSKGGRKKR